MRPRKKSQIFFSLARRQFSFQRLRQDFKWSAKHPRYIYVIKWYSHSTWCLMTRSITTSSRSPSSSSAYHHMHPLQHLHGSPSSLFRDTVQCCLNQSMKEGILDLTCDIVLATDVSNSRIWLQLGLNFGTIYYNIAAKTQGGEFHKKPKTTCPGQICTNQNINARNLISKSRFSVKSASDMVQESPNSVQHGTIDIGSGSPIFGDLHRTFRLQTPKIRWYRYETFIGISRGPAWTRPTSKPPVTSRWTTITFQ
jgi:hypothetical protein